MEKYSCDYLCDFVSLRSFLSILLCVTDST